MADGEKLSARERFDALWKIGQENEDGLVKAVVTEPYVEGSLRPEVRQVRAAGVVGEVLCVSNVAITFGPEEASIHERLRLLEALAELEAKYDVVPTDFST
jgi:hypothetical protein